MLNLNILLIIKRCAEKPTKTKKFTLVALSYQFDWHWFNDYKTFGRGNKGGASNSPIFYGLMAIAGSILLATVKNDENSQSESELKDSEV